jgi:[acyl-carrier-protein] S-malonyltransferase
MTSTALLFPGQGGQFVGMGADWAAEIPEIAELFVLADQATALPIARLCREGPIAELSKTRYLQPAVLTVGLAAWRLAARSGLKPSFAAGHSLGEFGALAAAGVLGIPEALSLVARRACIMERVAGERPGAMAAILNLSAPEVEAICELARDQGIIVPANYNTPKQTVVSGEAKAVAAAIRFAELKGGKAVPLPVSGAFHSPLMSEAGALFEQEIDLIEFRTPRFPVVPNAYGRPVSDPVEIKRLLKAQMTSPVLFANSVATLTTEGVDDWVECWPKPYLSPMVRKSLPEGAPKVVIRQAGKA